MSVHTDNERKVTETMNKIIDGGKDNVQVFLDFDYTLTKANQPIISLGLFIFPEMEKTLSDMLKTCEVISRNDTISETEKQIMASTLIYNYIKSFMLVSTYEYLHYFLFPNDVNFRGLPLSPDFILKSAIERSPELRDGIESMLDNLCKANISVVIFSAGFADFIEAILKRKNLLYPNIKIIGNYFACEKGIVQGFKNSVIINLHNKNDPVCLESVETRKNIVVVGDSLGDANMADGILNKENVLKIGLRSKKSSVSLSDYLNVFDIVVEDDDSLKSVNDILSKIYQ